MTRLQSQWNRLYALPTSHSQAGTQDGVRGMVLALRQPAHWETLSAVWQGVQADLGWPAPAIAVNGTDGYQLWFSLQDPVPAARVQACLNALCRRYLPDVAPHRLHLLHDAPMPGSPVQPDQWSAYVAQDLAPMFAETPWLDMPPSPEGQADLLSRMGSIPAEAFQAVLGESPAATAPSNRPGDESSQAPARIDTMGSSPCEDPKRFLLNVMNDDSVALSLRIEAAKALMPYMHDEKGPG